MGEAPKLAHLRDPALHAREHVRRLKLSDPSPEEEVILRLPCFASLGWIAPSCYTPAERALVLALARHAGLLATPAVIDIKPDPWPPEGWRINNPDWPSGEGPHLVRKD